MTLMMLFACTLTEFFTMILKKRLMSLFASTSFASKLSDDGLFSGFVANNGGGGGCITVSDAIGLSWRGRLRRVLELVVVFTR
jgi:hypothetical protein